MLMSKNAALFFILAPLALAFSLSQVYAQSQPKKPQSAQPAQPAQSTPVQPTVGEPVITVVLKPSPIQDDWIKLCGEDKNTKVNWCLITRDFVSDQNSPVAAVAVYDIQGEPTKTLRLLLPLSLLLQPGARLSIDQGQSQPTKFMLCTPDGCYSEIKVKEDFINTIKKGISLNVSVRNQFDKEVSLQMPIGNFGKVFEGKPTDPAVLEAQQKIGRAHV